MSIRSREWQQANRLLMAKILSELHFEEVLNYSQEVESQDANSSIKNFTLTTSLRDWCFSASRSIWGMLIVDPESIISTDHHEPDACQLLIDIQPYMKINDINLSGLLEEIQQTLYADCTTLRLLPNYDAKTLVQMTEVQRQQFLLGHPKAIANKGRIGWGEQDLAAYAPESGNVFNLHCLAVRRHVCQQGIQPGISEQHLWTDTFGEHNWEEFQQQLSNLNKEPDDYVLVPVHPWQKQRFLTAQYATMFAHGDIVDLGDIDSENWISQQSIRTLSAESMESHYDIKTAISILNTSCYRGITGDFIHHGARLSQWLENQIQADPLLQQLGMQVQKEVAGVFCSHPYQSQLVGGAYRYKEMLGCIWRERAESVLQPNQRPMSMATLMQSDAQGRSCIDALIELSGMSAEHWLRRMFRHVVVPLYHLMCQYGVALVAHGQNITLALENHIPVGCIIKDFHGDLRLIDDDFAELQSLDKDIQDKLTRLPPHYLIHDLLTGHFVTVLRFVSPLLKESQVSETEFYAWLADEIRQYQGDHPHLQNRFEQLDLLAPKIEKVCINRVRFRIGYGDSDERPLPELGQPMSNPLCMHNVKSA